MIRCWPTTMYRAEHQGNQKMVVINITLEYNEWQVSNHVLTVILRKKEKAISVRVPLRGQNQFFLHASSTANILQDN